MTSSLRTLRVEGPTPSDGGVLHVGIVHAGATICEVAVGRSQAELLRGLAGYVGQNAGFQLCPAEAEKVLALLRNGHLAEAVDGYFGSDAQRWGRERLTQRIVGLPDRVTGGGALTPAYDASGERGTSTAAGGEGEPSIGELRARWVRELAAFESALQG